MSLPARLQLAIEGLYRIEGPARVEDFRLDHEAVAEALGLQRWVSEREMLLVQNDGEFTDVGLFVAEDIVTRAEAFFEAPANDHDGAGIDSFCVLLEGVSHFVYFTYCGALDRPVSLIELELQAELDKFLLLRLWSTIPQLLEKLYTRFELAADLDRDEVERYHVANQRARRYAHWLDRKFKTGAVPAALEDARALYRKPFSFKLDHIARAA